MTRTWMWLVMCVGGCSSSTTAWLPAGTTVPELGPALLERVDQNDGVQRVVELTYGFAEDEPVAYWDFGPVPDEGTARMYLFCQRQGSAPCMPVEHPPVITALPGEAGYSHFGRVHQVELTPAWSGQIMASPQAIEDAVRDGLASDPRETSRYAHCPVVHPDVRVDLGNGAVASPEPAYYQGMTAHCVPFYRTHGERSLADPGRGTVLVRNVYVLTRDGEDMPLSEAARGIDWTGDGDTRDTNGILGVAYMSPQYTPLWNVVMVTVPAGYASIDTSGEQTVADHQAATDMFMIDGATYEIEPIAGAVVSYEITPILVDCPVQSSPGAL